MSFNPWNEKTKVLTVLSPDQLSKEKAETVTNIKDVNKQLFYQLAKTAYYNKVESISAPQVGINKRVLVYRSQDGRWKAMYNPSIVYLQGEQALRWEKCCSYPNKNMQKSRINRATIQFWNHEEKMMVVTFTNIDLSHILHELEHLDGQVWYKEQL